MDDENDSCRHEQCPQHVQLFSDVKLSISKLDEMHGDIKCLRGDIHEAVLLAQEGIVKNAKDTAVLQEQMKIIWGERPILFKVVGYKNRVIGAFGVVAFVLTVFGLKLFGG